MVFYHSFILHRLEEGQGQYELLRWSAPVGLEPATPACESPALLLCYRRRQIMLSDHHVKCFS